jgi:2-iminobutanoate/2-iminopropanoate deaminase
MSYTLAQLDSMTIEVAQGLPFADRDELLDLIVADGRKQATATESYRTGLYSDYFEADLTRLLKVKAVRVQARGTTDSDFAGTPQGSTPVEKYEAAFRHLQTILDAAGVSLARIVTLVVFLTDMDQWATFNGVYRKLMPNPPLRAVIGTTGLAQKPLAIEFVEVIAYKVSPNHPPHLPQISSPLRGRRVRP